MYVILVTINKSLRGTATIDSCVLILCNCTLTQKHFMVTLHLDTKFLLYGELLCVIIVLSMFALLMYLLLVPCILVSHINKLKKWLFHIYLLNTITKVLYQSSEKGMSLLFTCPELTEEESSLLAAAARMQLLSTAHIMQYFYQIESYHSSSSCGLSSMHFDGSLILLYFIELLPCTVSYGERY